MPITPSVIFSLGATLPAAPSARAGMKAGTARRRRGRQRTLQKLPSCCCLLLFHELAPLSVPHSNAHQPFAFSETLIGFAAWRHP